MTTEKHIRCNLIVIVAGASITSGLVISSLDKSSFTRLFLPLYLPPGYKFITRDPNRPLDRIQDGPFGCGSELQLVN